MYSTVAAPVCKWNKPGGERQIPYDLTYKWNLIKKTNKQAKYNQRHANKEQTDSNQREGGGDNGRKKGKGYQGTCRKDPGTTSKGRRIEGGGGEGESGGGKMEMIVLEQ